MLLAAALLVVTGCKKDNKTENNGEKMIFTATIDNGAKTQINGFDQVWNTGDKVKINGEEFTVTPKAGDPSWATFEGLPVDTSGGTYKAIFPAYLEFWGEYELPATQTYNGNNLSGVNPLYAESTTQELVFHNICALMKLNLKGNGTDKVTEIKVSADQALSGYFEVKERSEGYFAELVTSGGSADVTLMCGDGVALTEEGTTFYIAIPEYDNYSNLTFTATTSEGKTWTYKANGGNNIAILANNLYESTQTPVFVPAEYPGLCFTAQQANSDVALMNYGSPALPDFEISVNGNSWTNYTPGSFILLENIGDKIYFRKAGEGVATSFSTDYNNYAYFAMTGKIAASGNVMSLIDPSCEAKEIPCDKCFYRLFINCSSLTAAPTLPATSLKEACYCCMFIGCGSLTAAPELPATNLAVLCYSSMFQDCTSLTAVPNLPATNLAEYCYQIMFNGCSKLTAAPALNATNLAERCCDGMFQDCTSLTAAPELPATNLADYCYNSMFYGCSKLTAAPALNAMTLVEGCYSFMFSGCSSLTAAPELPATNLVGECYKGMFERCSKLNYIKVHFTDWASDISATSSWVSGVPAGGTFYCPSGFPETHGDSFIPNRWKKVNL